MSMLVRPHRWARGARGWGRIHDEGPLRRLSWRLAALTMGPLCVLLLVLGVVLYVTMGAALQATMRQTLQARALEEIEYAAGRVGGAGPGQYPGPGPNQPGARPGPQDRAGFGHQPGPGAAQPVAQSLTPPVLNANGTFVLIADAGLHCVGTIDGSPFGQTLADRAAGEQVLQTDRPLFSTRSRPTGGSYLLYTMPVSTGGHTWGVIQVGLAEGPYTASLHLLVQMLLLVSVLGLVAIGVVSRIFVWRALLPIRAALRHQRDFVADAAHEMRTPVTILRNAAELGLVSLADLGLPPPLLADQQAAYEQALIQSNHLGRLVDDLSLLARADSGAVTLERAPVDLARLTRETLAGMELLAEDRGVRLKVAVSGERRVVGDAGRLRQVLLILLDNAIKHTPPGGTITINVDRHGGSVRLQVRDTGAGIAPHDLPHVFDRFYRAGQERRSEGSGLGLAIARWIVDAHGGRIGAANAPGGGAIFTVTLPAR